MKHPTTEQLTAFHDGIADARTLVAVEEHLNSCAECHDVLAALEQQDRALTAALSHDPGDEHFELLAARIERKLGTSPRAADAAPAAALPGAAAWLRETAAHALSSIRGLFGARGKLRLPEWAGAVAALVLGVGLMLIGVQHSLMMRNRALDQRTGQAAQGSRAAGEAAGGAPEASAPSALPPAAGRKSEAARPAQPPAVTPAPGAAAKQDAAANRASRMVRAPSGEEVRADKSRGMFAKQPPADQGAGLKSRRATPLEENRPKVEAPAPGAKEAERDQGRNEARATPSEKPAAPPPAAAIAPEPAPAAARTNAPRQSITPAPAATAEPQAQKLAADAQRGARTEPGAGLAPAAVRLCGVVKDSRGRPIPSATVTLVSQGSGVSSDAGGRFCIEAPPGDQTLSVIAVGFSPLQFDVHVAAGSPPLVLTLLAVSVLGESGALRGNVQALGGLSATGAPGTVGQLLPGFPDSLQPVASRAIRLTLEAERMKSAQRYETAAVEWERVRERASGGQIEAEARFRIAEARYHAWELAPTPKRVATANEALTSFLVRAPLGARRDTASAWLGRVKP